jgi:hypothetical protein
MADRSLARDPVCLAVDLGWLLAELYGSRRLPGPPRNAESRALPAQLPGIGRMTPHEKACALAAQAGADLALLGTALGTELPTAESIRIVLEKAGHTRDDVRAAVYDLYLDIRNRLAGTDPGAAVAFGLGRLLADTALLPTSGEPELLAERFERYRMANILAWLDDLDARLPSRSASAVRASLRQWERWVGSRRDADGRIDPAEVDEGVIRALRRQGSLWRRLLAGQQAADQLLDGRAYVGAAASLLANGRRLAFYYMWKWSWAILIALGAVGGAIWAALTYAPAGTDRVIAVLISAAGFLGLSWAGVRATLGRAVRQAEHAMWEAEVVAAIGKAATIGPEKQSDQPGPLVAEEPEPVDAGPALTSRLDRAAR